MKLALIALVAAAVGLAVGAALWSGGDDDGDSAATASVAATDLYVVDGRLTSVRSTGADAVEVRVDDPTVLWFTDRPARLNGSRPIGEFVADWPSTFGEDPPNAAVLVPSDDRSRRPVAVELQRPSFDRSTGVATFALRPERGSDERTAAWLATLERMPPSELGRLVLFVDSGSPLPGPGPPTPGEALATAFAQGEEAIDVINDFAAQGGSLGTEAAQDLQQLQEDAAAR